MVQTYTIFGRQVGSHILAITTLTVTFGGAYLAVRKPKKSLSDSPPITAKSKDEEVFIKQYVEKKKANVKA